MLLLSRSHVLVKVLYCLAVCVCICLSNRVLHLKFGWPQKMGITYTHGVNVLLVSLMILLVNGQENENGMSEPIHSFILDQPMLVLLMFLEIAAVHYHDTVVIGAGPAGLQHSWYLKTSGADYITFEQAASPGGSFKTVPRWRKLISINKVNLGKRERQSLCCYPHWGSGVVLQGEILWTTI